MIQFEHCIVPFCMCFPVQSSSPHREEDPVNIAWSSSDSEQPDDETQEQHPFRVTAQRQQQCNSRGRPTASTQSYSRALLMLSTDKGIKLSCDLLREKFYISGYSNWSSPLSSNISFFCQFFNDKTNSFWPLEVLYGQTSAFFVSVFMTKTYVGVLSVFFMYSYFFLQFAIFRSSKWIGQTNITFKCKSSS